MAFVCSGSSSHLPACGGTCGTERSAPPWWPWRCLCGRYAAEPEPVWACLWPRPEWQPAIYVAGVRGRCSRCGPDVMLSPGWAWEDVAALGWELSA